MDTLDEIRQTFRGSRHRYIEHFLSYPKSAQDTPNELEAELPNLQRAFRWTLEEGDKNLIPKFWNDVKDFVWDSGFWQIFIDWGESALAVLNQSNDPENQAWVLSELGWFWMEQGDFITAEDCFRRSQTLFKSVNNDEGTCAVERYLGVLAYRAGDFERAKTHYEQALELATAHGYSGMIAEIRNLQGSLARKLGDFAGARQFYEVASREIERLGDPWRLTVILRNLARMEFQLGNLEAARQGFLKAVAVCEEIDRKDMLFGCQLRLAEVELELGDTDKARELAITARTGFAELGMSRDLEAANEFLEGL